MSDVKQSEVEHLRSITYDQTKCVMRPDGLVEVWGRGTSQGEDTGWCWLCVVPEGLLRNVWIE